MGLRLEIISEHRDDFGDEAEHTFGPAGGTIGRAKSNDWVLTDKERYISGQHATVDYKSGSYYLADTSSNGVYVNRSSEKLGNGPPRRLFDGDELRMGSIELRVHLDEGEDFDVPPEKASAIITDTYESLVPEEDMDGELLLDASEITGENVFSAAEITGESAFNAAFAESNKGEIPAKREGNGTPNRELLNTFFRAAGIDPDDIHPSVDAVEVMTNAGELLHEVVAGLSRLLAARTNFKSMFRLDQTTVLPRHNNALKLSIDTVDSLKQLLVGSDGEYLGPLDSVRQASKDLSNHHDAVVAAMIRGFDAYLERFHPAQLEERFKASGEGKSMFGKVNRRKYWEMYEDLYPILTEKSTANLPQQFAEDFVVFYELMLKDFKRRDLTMGDTQRLDKAALARPEAVHADADESGSFQATNVMDPNLAVTGATVKPRSGAAGGS